MASNYSGKVTANGFCAQMLAKELDKSEICVYVVSCDEAGTDKIQNRVISVSRRETVTPTSSNNVLLRMGHHFINILKYLRTPKYGKETVEKMVEAAMKICARVKIDAIVCMYFPLETVIAGYRMKQLYPDLEFIIYELDSVADGIAGSSKWGNHIVLSFKRFLNKIYYKADLVLILKCHQTYWMREHSRYREKMEIVDLPLLTETCQPKKVDAEKMTRLVYSGTLDEKYRSPEVLLQVLLGIDDNIDWNLDFYSKGCEAILERYSNQNNRIICHGYVEQNILESAVSEASFLINIGNKVSNSLPSKVITYMTYGKPIIHFSLQENDICEEYLANYPATLIIKHNMSRNEAIEKVGAFIKKYKGVTVLLDDLFDLFPMNLPSYSANKILERLYHAKHSIN